MSDSPILLFDGVCNLCNALVQFVLKHEREPIMRFASLQSDEGRAILERFGQSPDALDTVVFVESGRAHTKSDAALRAARHLRAPWSWVRCLRVVPRPVRDWVYDRVAHNRYRWFGKRDACWVPTPETAARFLQKSN